jgi:hypothetical protein
LNQWGARREINDPSTLCSGPKHYNHFGFLRDKKEFVRDDG